MFLAILVAFFVSVASSPHPTSSDSLNAIRKFSAAWDSIRNYECTIHAHEVKDGRVQDRAYQLIFSRPFDTRVEITDGDGKGSELVWRGGSTVRAHRGGLLKGIKVTLDLHSHLVTSIRGTTVADINFGALLQHLKLVRGQVIEKVDSATTDRGGFTMLTLLPKDPDEDGGISKEIYLFRGDGLPIEIDQYQERVAVKRITVENIKLNVTPGTSAFEL